MLTTQLVQLKISGMSCGHCVNAIQKILKDAGIENANVDLTQSNAKFEGSEEQKKIAIAAINKSGIYKILEE